jgi:hypothetical protein
MTSTPATTAKPSLWRRAWSFCFANEPTYHASWETLLMRAGVAWVTWITVKGISPVTGQPKPHGFANYFDFTWCADAGVLSWVTPCVAVLLLLYTLGIAVPIVLVPIIYVSIAQGTLPNCQGAIGHTTQIITLTLIAQWLASVWFAWCSVKRKPTPHDFNGAQLMADWGRQMIAASYVASALTKLWESGGSWIQDTPYFGLQIAKSTDMGFYNYLQKPDNAEWLGQYLIDNPILAQLMIGVGLPLELFAFAALLNRRVALFYGIALYIFHSTVSEIMHLGFLYNKWLLVILFVNPVWWAVQGVGKLKRLKLKS